MKDTRSVWQISGGPLDRNYADIFLKYSVALIGPGDAGPWNPERDDKEFEGGFVRRFADEVQKDDVCLLRTGLSTIRAVGLVASEYLYLPQFDDVNGWDLQHARRVLWRELPHSYSFETSIFGANPPRLSKVGNFEVLDYAANVNDLCSIYWDSQAFGDHPTEDELVAHYVVPFLRRLGWSVEQVAVKWKHIDVCVFKKLPRSPENCHFIIEAKRLGAGVEGALEQAKGYLEMLGISRDVVVTDGIRYRMYSSQNGFTPIAYANLARLKQSALELFSYIKTP